MTLSTFPTFLTFLTRELCFQFLLASRAIALAANLRGSRVRLGQSAKVRVRVPDVRPADAARIGAAMPWGS
jgi:hypothetical protein